MKKIGKYLILLLTTIFILGLSINVYARTDMNGNDGGRGDETASNGFSVGSNVGWRIYVLDENGNAKSEAVDSMYYIPSYDVSNFATRHGEIASNQVTGCEIPKALYAGNDEDGAECWYSNYGEVKGWLDADRGDGKTNAHSVIYEYFGEELANAFIDGSETLYFCLEPIYCMGIFNGPDSSSCIGRAYGTPNNWANLMTSLGIGRGTFLWHPLYTIVPLCVYIENDYDNLGFIAPIETSGEIEPQMTQYYGYGLGVLMTDGLLQHTKIEGVASPHNSPEPGKDEGAPRPSEEFCIL